MAKVIIGIHGLGNKPPKKVLENWWNLAMIEGLEKLGKPVKPFQFELIYWADVMYPKPLDVNISNKDDAFYLGEKYIPSPENFVEESHPKRKKILDYLTKQLDSLFLNDDFSLNYKFLTDTILHRYFKDLDSYYKEKCKIDNSEECNAKEIIRTRIAEVIKKYKKDEILILGHSMGSILAYDVLAFILKDIKIDTLLTIGSPLGFPIVKGKIAAEQKLNHLFTKHLRTPKSVKRNWLNFSDLEDKVAFNYKLSDDFQENIYNVKPVDFIVDNDYEYLGEKNPHKSFGYLRAPQFSEKLYEFLELKKLNIWFLIWKKITGLINKITAQLTFLRSKLFWSYKFLMYFLPYQADFTFWLDPKSKQKSQGCVRLTRKSYMTSAKITELVVPPQTAVISLRQHHLFSGSPPEATLRCYGRCIFMTAFLIKSGIKLKH